MLGQLTPSECALDEFSQDEIPEKPNQSLGKETPNNTSKGKQRASNYQNINPKRKAQVARDGLSFDMLKFEWQVKNDDKGLGEKKLDWEKEEKEKDQSFEMAKLEKLASQEHIGKNCNLLTQCVVSRNRTEEID
ncbi:hypothetical protein VP01_4620g1 [Puccinia sorghi]|uniref:No apical meristem-associated C-terminal domain-containing protein n=1 Tax=Puccinia sorghi TaxID=27349 RepID=A0A0L6UNF0_9BASI|nr:hypothetical protein VP01_4620g1 [Puccinia sorghi]